MTTEMATRIAVGLAILVALLAVYIIALPKLIRPTIRLILAVRYGFRVAGRSNVPRTGPAVLAANHLTWIDGLFLAATSPRDGRIFANADFFKNRIAGWLARRAGIIPVPFSGPKAQRAAILAVRESLDRGELVAIFPEGQLTRNGMLGPFYRGLEVILRDRAEVAVVPTALDNLWGSIFSYQGGRSFGKRPVGLRRTIRVAFGAPLYGPPTLFQVRLAILDAMVDAVELGRKPPVAPDAVVPSLPRLEVAGLGLITGSAEDFDRGGVAQPGQRPGTVGLPLPGVAIRTIDLASGKALGEGEVGRVEARLAGRAGWNPLKFQGSIDRDGFLTIVEPTTG